MYGLSEVYESEHDAEKAMLKNDLVKSIAHHETSVNMLTSIIDRIKAEQHTNHFNTIGTLETLSTQIRRRIEQLKIILKAKELKELKQQQSTNQTEQTEQHKSIKPNGTIPDASSTNNDRAVTALIDKINLLMIKNLNTDVGVNKIRFIEQKKINELEHDLQLINFKEKSSKQQTLEEAKAKNDILTNLNLVYYSELIANHDFLKDLTDLLKKEDYRDSEVDKEDDDQPRDQEEVTNLKTIIQELQAKNSNLERDRIVLENQIVKLKERWNNLVESARKRKELELQTQRDQ